MMQQQQPLPAFMRSKQSQHDEMLRQLAKEAETWKVPQQMQASPTIPQMVPRQYLSQPQQGYFAQPSQQPQQYPYQQHPQMQQPMPQNPAMQRPVPPVMQPMQQPMQQPSKPVVKPPKGKKMILSVLLGLVVLTTLACIASLIWFYLNYVRK
jgi:hypothetical protein